MKIGTFIEFANISNQIIDLWMRDRKNDDLFLIYSGMEHELLKTSVCDLTFKRIFGHIPESMLEADHINIEVMEEYYPIESEHIKYSYTADCLVPITDENTVEEDNLNIGADYVC